MLLPTRLLPLVDRPARARGLGMDSGSLHGRVRAVRVLRVEDRRAVRHLLMRARRSNSFTSARLPLKASFSGSGSSISLDAAARAIMDRTSGPRRLPAPDRCGD